MWLIIQMGDVREAGDGVAAVQCFSFIHASVNTIQLLRRRCVE
jgi:hypothetical protein